MLARLGGSTDLSSVRASTNGRDIIEHLLVRRETIHNVVDEASAGAKHIDSG
jgi:hypothetical protein